MTDADPDITTATDPAPDILAADITALIMDDHDWFRRQFAKIDDARNDAELGVAWGPLAQRLDTHAEAEETVFYPLLLKKGGSESDEETDDAIRDHNKIRDAVAEAHRHAIGSDAWFTAVGDARKENTEHMGEEEDEVLPDFRKHVSHRVRAELAAKWVQFYAEHPGGRDIDTSDRNPHQYVEENS